MILMTIVQGTRAAGHPILTFMHLFFAIGKDFKIK
jgi:hypothetical protein